MELFPGFKVKTWKRFSRLWFKFYWYKWVKKLDIIGFYEGVPIIRTEYLEEYKECGERD